MESERRRNAALAAYQNKTNPFIDDPALASTSLILLALVRLTKCLHPFFVTLVDRALEVGIRKGSPLFTTHLDAT